jgi:hypothetical protein
MKKTGLGLAVSLAVAVPLILAPAASAVTLEASCTTGGFTGWINVTETAQGGLVEYRINKGSNSGGNSANVNSNDFSTNPVTVRKSPDHLLQDNVYHPLWYIGHFGQQHNIGYTIIFDKSGAADPSCGVFVPW